DLLELVGRRPVVGDGHLQRNVGARCPVPVLRVGQRCVVHMQRAHLRLVTVDGGQLGVGLRDLTGTTTCRAGHDGGERERGEAELHPALTGTAGHTGILSCPASLRQQDYLGVRAGRTPAVTPPAHSPQWTVTPSTFGPRHYLREHTDRGFVNPHHGPDQGADLRRRTRGAIEGAVARANMEEAKGAEDTWFSRSERPSSTRTTVQHSSKRSRLASSKARRSNTSFSRSLKVILRCASPPTTPRSSVCVMSSARTGSIAYSMCCVLPTPKSQPTGLVGTRPTWRSSPPAM